MRAPCDPSVLRELLDYNPETGMMRWRSRTPDKFVSGRRSAESICAVWNGHYAGKPAFVTPCAGYRVGGLFGVSMRAHRVAWAHFHGYWPDGEVDHINGDRADNRILNLRIANAIEQNRNRRLDRRNSSGVHGVRFYNGRWQADIGVRGKRIPFGNFKSINEAIAARRHAEHLYGFHPNHGRAPT